MPQSPGEIPWRGWRDIALRIKGRMSKDNFSVITAGVAFYALMAMFPALFALIALYGLFCDPSQIAQQVAMLGELLPEQAKDIVVSELHDLVLAGGKQLGLGAVFGLGAALWGASQGIRALMQALNVAYGETERRGFFRFYATAVALTLAAFVGALLVVGLLVAIPVAARMLGIGALAQTLVTVARWPLLALLAMFELALVSRFGPSREHARWEWVSRGAIFAMAAWLIGSAGFSLFVENFASYSKTYGSVAAVVVLLTWLLLSAYAFLIGAEINAESVREA